MSNVVLYCEKLPTEGMETLISELCPKELDLRFLYPVKNGKKGDFEDADYILASICKIGKPEMDRAKNLKLIHVPATGYNHVDIAYAKERASRCATPPVRTPPRLRSSPLRSCSPACAA